MSVELPSGRGRIRFWGGMSDSSRVRGARHVQPPTLTSALNILPSLPGCRPRGSRQFIHSSTNNGCPKSLGEELVPGPTQQLDTDELI